MIVVVKVVRAVQSVRSVNWSVEVIQKSNKDNLRLWKG